MQELHLSLRVLLSSQQPMQYQVVILRVPKAARQLVAELVCVQVDLVLLEAGSGGCLTRAFCACIGACGLSDNDSGSLLETLWIKHLLKKGVDMALQAMCPLQDPIQCPIPEIAWYRHLLLHALESLGCLPFQTPSRLVRRGCSISLGPAAKTSST